MIGIRPYHIPLSYKHNVHVPIYHTMHISHPKYVVIYHNHLHKRVFFTDGTLFFDADNDIIYGFGIYINENI
jgi:hypothetical protein